MLEKKEVMERLEAIATEAREKIGHVLMDHYQDGGYEKEGATTLFLTSTEVVADLIKHGKIGHTHHRQWLDAFNHPA